MNVLRTLSSLKSNRHPSQTLSTIAPPKNQPKSVTKKVVILRLIFGSRLHEEPHMGNISENKHKRWNSLLVVVLGVFYLD